MCARVCARACVYVRVCVRARARGAACVGSLLAVSEPESYAHSRWLEVGLAPSPHTRMLTQPRRPLPVCATAATTRPLATSALARPARRPSSTARPPVSVALSPLPPNSAYKADKPSRRCRRPALEDPDGHLRSGRLPAVRASRRRPVGCWPLLRQGVGGERERQQLPLAENLRHWRERQRARGADDQRQLQ